MQSATLTSVEPTAYLPETTSQQPWRALTYGYSQPSAMHLYGEPRSTDVAGFFSGSSANSGDPLSPSAARGHAAPVGVPRLNIYKLHHHHQDTESMIRGDEAFSSRWRGVDETLPQVEMNEATMQRRPFAPSASSSDRRSHTYRDYGDEFLPNNKWYANATPLDARAYNESGSAKEKQRIRDSRVRKRNQRVQNGAMWSEARRTDTEQGLSLGDSIRKKQEKQEKEPVRGLLSSVIEHDSHIGVPGAATDRPSVTASELTLATFPDESQRCKGDGYVTGSVTHRVLRSEHRTPSSSGSAAEAMHQEWQMQFYKTKMCPYHSEGRCVSGKSCRFAHSHSELRPLPDLRRTKLCDSYIRETPCVDPTCPFAHTPSELRTSSNSFYKVTLCNFYKKGKCWNGPHCRFAHGALELRDALASANQELFPSLPSEVVSAKNEDITLQASELYEGTSLPQHLRGVTVLKRSASTLNTQPLYSLKTRNNEAPTGDPANPCWSSYTTLSTKPPTGRSSSGDFFSNFAVADANASVTSDAAYDTHPLHPSIPLPTAVQGPDSGQDTGGVEASLQEELRRVRLEAESLKQFYQHDGVRDNIGLHRLPSEGVRRNTSFGFNAAKAEQQRLPFQVGRKDVSGLLNSVKSDSDVQEAKNLFDTTREGASADLSVGSASGHRLLDHSNTMGALLGVHFQDSNSLYDMETACGDPKGNSRPPPPLQTPTGTGVSTAATATTDNYSQFSSDAVGANSSEQTTARPSVHPSAVRSETLMGVAYGLLMKSVNGTSPAASVTAADAAAIDTPHENRARRGAIGRNSSPSPGLHPGRFQLPEEFPSAEEESVNQATNKLEVSQETLLSLNQLSALLSKAFSLSPRASENAAAQSSKVDANTSVTTTAAEESNCFGISSGSEVKKELEVRDFLPSQVAERRTAAPVASADKDDFLKISDTRVEEVLNGVPRDLSLVSDAAPLTFSDAVPGLLPPDLELLEFTPSFAQLLESVTAAAKLVAQDSATTTTGHQIATEVNPAEPETVWLPGCGNGSSASTPTASLFASGQLAFGNSVELLTHLSLAATANAGGDAPDGAVGRSAEISTAADEKSRTAEVSGGRPPTSLTDVAATISTLFNAALSELEDNRTPQARKISSKEALGSYEKLITWFPTTLTAAAVRTAQEDARSAAAFGKSQEFAGSSTPPPTDTSTSGHCGSQSGRQTPAPLSSVRSASVRSRTSGSSSVENKAESKYRCDDLRTKAGTVFATDCASES